MAFQRWLLFALLALVSAAAPAHAQSNAANWSTVAGGSNLIRPVYWEGLPSASTGDGTVTLQSPDEATPVIDAYGPRLTASGDFQVVASLESDTDGLADLALVDDVPSSQWGPSMRRLEIGLQGGQVVVGVFDGSSASPALWQTFDVEPPQGPVTLAVSRQAQSLVIEASGQELTRFDDPGIFPSGHILLGARVAGGNQLTLHSLDVQADGQAAPPTVDRCTPTRLLVAGDRLDDGDEEMWWVWPDDNLVRQIEPAQSEEAFLVAVSPDNRWVTYYQRNSKASPDPDRFIVDTWVMDLQTDDRYKLVEGNAPLGWVGDSRAVVLGERPGMMALVPTGELVPTEGQLLVASSLRVSNSPNGQLRAAVATTSVGAAGVNITDTATQSQIQNIPTGRGAVQLAWSPDSSRLAFTSGTQAGVGILTFRLRLVNMADHSVTLLDSTQNMDLHSVIWAPPLPGCT